jgi:hypothetical protein
MKPIPAVAFASALLLATVLTGPAQNPAPNHDESKVAAYTLPDPLRCEDGTPVTSAAQWTARRRPELLNMFAGQVYGRTPVVAGRPRVVLDALKTNALGGLATRKEYTVWLTGQTNGPSLELLLYLPNARRGPAPAFLAMNFKGNQAVSREADLRLTGRWLANTPDGSVTNNRATPLARGTEASRWPLTNILERGYALATVYYGDVEPDHPEGWRQGVRGALSPAGANTVFQADEWGAIAAWAWGLSRALDALERDAEVDARRVALLGHSRLGKTALWAGAQDERFAIVISNESGEGGAALARRNFGETTANLVDRFPHWFCGNFKQYAGRADALPVDQHQLLALIAPRPLYVASAAGDQWADPRGEFLAAVGADPVYALLGRPGLGVVEMPGTNQPVGQNIGYHIRAGKHDVTSYDWEQFLNFADRHLKPRP